MTPEQMEADQETAHFCLAPTRGVGFDAFHEAVDRVITALAAAREEGRLAALAAKEKPDE